MHSSEAVESFKNSIMRCLNFHYGPYIHLLDTGTAQMAKLMNRVERRMEKLMYQYDKHANIDGIILIMMFKIANNFTFCRIAQYKPIVQKHCKNANFVTTFPGNCNKNYSGKFKPQMQVGIFNNITGIDILILDVYL